MRDGVVELVKYDAAKRALAEAHRVDEVKEIRDKAAAVAVYAAQAKDTELERYATEIRLRAERRAGELLRDMDKNHGAVPGKTGVKARPVLDTTPKLSDLGIGKSQSSRWQRLADLPADQFEAEILRGRDPNLLAKRTAKKAEYNARVAATKSKPFEGTYRIIYADPPWKYIGLNQMDDHGHAEGHYNCMTDDELCSYRPDGKQFIKDLTDDNAVLFLWVTSPLLRRCFKVIDAWGFEYKASFVWDKDAHVMGHYNSVRHEFLLICTRGSCKPDVPKLINSVQRIKRSGKHSEKPREFYDIIGDMYDHGRKLELFARGTAPAGWDTDGNESDNARVAA